MEPLQKDIKTLDYIVKACLEKEFIQSDLELPESKKNAPHGVDMYKWINKRLNA